MILFKDCDIVHEEKGWEEKHAILTDKKNQMTVFIRPPSTKLWT